MVRFAKFSIVGLAVGALLNLFVAWVASASTPLLAADHPDLSTVTSGSCFSSWQVSRTRNSATIVLRSYWVDRDIAVGGSFQEGRVPPEALIPRWAQAAAPRCGTQSTNHQSILVASGWPWPSLWGGVSRAIAHPAPPAYTFHQSLALRKPNALVTQRLNSGWVTYGLEGAFSRIIPFAPMWHGLLLNTIFYALLFTLLVGLRRALILLRRYHRVRRLQCPVCTYPMGGSPTCSECGASLPSTGVA